MEKISFKNSKDLNLAGIFHIPKIPTDKVVIIAHGFTASMDRPRLINLANTLTENDIAVLRFDFGGCGESEVREITISDQVDDLQSAIVYAQNKGYTNIGVLGESLGGLTALQAFSKSIQVLVLWFPTTKPSSFSDFPDEILAGLELKGRYIKTREDGSIYSISEKYYDELCGFTQKEILEKVTIPTLIVHGEADDKEPIENSVEALQYLPKGSKLERINNIGYGKHTMEADMDKVMPVTVGWFVSHF